MGKSKPCMGGMVRTVLAGAETVLREEIEEMASIFINSLYLLGSIVALGLGVVMVKAIIDTLRRK